MGVICATLKTFPRRKRPLCSGKWKVAKRVQLYLCQDKITQLPVISFTNAAHLDRRV